MIEGTILLIAWELEKYKEQTRRFQMESRFEIRCKSISTVNAKTPIGIEADSRARIMVVLQSDIHLFMISHGRPIVLDKRTAYLNSRWVS